MAALIGSIAAFTTFVLAICGAVLAIRKTSKALRELWAEGLEWSKLIKPIFSKSKAIR